MAWKVKITLGRGIKRKRVEIFALESIHEERKRDKQVSQEVENTQDRGEKRV